MLKVAVENNLSNVKDYLKNKGLTVDTFDPNAKDYKAYDAIVLTGQSDNLMDIQDTYTNAVVVEAAGLTPEEVYKQLTSTTK